MTVILWTKAAHLIAMVCWFAGLFYLPRLFVYHATATDAPSRERFEVMEAKLYRIIMNPAMIATLVFGVWLLIETWNAHAASLWLWIKVALVVGLVGHHHICRRIMRMLAAGKPPGSERFLRLFNEVPTIALVLIVILAVIKPF